MKKGSILFILVISLFSIINVSAGIYFSQPESYYNLGDVIEININVQPILEGFVKVDLVCEGGIINVFNGVSNEEGNINIKFPLTFAYIKENSGNCYFLGEYSDESQRSREFEISKALDIRLNIDNFVSKPNEEITISGAVKRLNGVGINGEVEIKIPLLGLTNLELTNSESKTDNEDNSSENVSEEIEEEITEVSESSAGMFNGRVVNGEFSVSFRLKEDTPAGDYRIDIFAYEKDSFERITSEGIAMANLQILQVLKNIDIALNSQSIDPGSSLEFKPMMIDQTGQPINDKISIIIRDENLNRIFEQILQSEDTSEYKVQSNLTSGYYEILASSGEINSVKKFYVNEKAIVFFEVINNTLIVTNIGNIPYKKDIQVELNGKPFVRSVDLDLGEKQEFKLTGDGEFNVKITDGETEITQDGVMLTGYSVNVETVKKGIVALNTPIIWIFLIVIIGAGLLFFFRNILKKKSFAYPIKEKFKNLGLHKKKTIDNESEINTRAPDINKTEEKIPYIPLIIPNKAEPVLVLKGHKNRVAVIVLRIKNKLTKNNKKDLNNILKIIYDRKGAIYESGDYLISVFSPLMTRSFKNEVTAAKAGELMQTSLKQYNKKFSDKIQFGIGIGSGEVVNKIEDKKLKFTALGNFLPNVKRTAEYSNEQVLLTKDAFERIGSEIKAIKNGNVYEVKRVVDGEKNQAFIDSFLKRIGKEG